MNKMAILGTTLLALGLGLGMSSNAYAYGYPPYACTAQTEGAIYYEQIGPYQYGGSYQINQWECWNSQWYRTEVFVCDYYGQGCIQM